MADNGQARDSSGTTVNWKLIIFRWIILLCLGFCFYLNVTAAIVRGDFLSMYSECSECRFAHFERFILGTHIAMWFLIILGIYFVITQFTRALRLYLMTFFLFVWLQMSVIIVLQQRYPLAHEVHRRWQEHRSLKDFQEKYECCGVFGPDDYMLTLGYLPKSCFYNKSMLTKDLFLRGCLIRDDIPATIFSYDLIIIGCEFLLLILLLGFYKYLKHIQAPRRFFRDLMISRALF